MRSVQTPSVQHSMKLPALSDGAGGAPALLFPVGGAMPSVAKMHGAMQEVQAGRFRIIPQKPLYFFASYSQSWYRILMLENGYYLRLQITPINPTVESEWAEMLGDKLDLIHWAGSSWTCGVNQSRYTQALPAEVVRHMHYHLGSPHAERLLTGDLWAEIEELWPTEYDRPYDVSDWLGRCGYNGGIPLEKVQKNPPTWTERHATEEAKRHKEREERITEAVGSEEPLNEAEKALGQSLEQHDWSYNYSDCGDTWKRGQSHRDELERGLKALPVERARLVWKAFVHPSNEQYWRCPV